MTEQQIFQLLGIAYFAVGFGALVNLKFYQKLIGDYLRTTPAMYLTGAIDLFVGYLLANYQFPDTGNFTWIIRTLGWVTVVKGLMILIVPKKYIAMAKYFRSNTPVFTFEILLVLILGVIMLYLGFLA